MTKSIKWKIKDLIDLDYLLFLRRNNTYKVSDRELYLDKIASSKDFKDLNPGQNNLVYLWLNAKKTEINESSDISMPGDSFEATVKLIIFIFFLLAFFTGLFAAFAFLSYSGSSAINVFYYFGLFAGLQILFLPFAIIPFLFGRNKNLLKKFSFFSPLSGLLKTVFEKIYKKFFQKSAKYKSDIFYFDFRKYSKPLFWLFFTISQSVAVLFSTGVLIGTIIKVVGSDLAFGWQTTLNAGPEYILKIVNFISAPWAWFVPDSFTAPSLEQIIGSKIVLKEGMALLSTSDMTSWWPFLCFSVLFYAVIPRLLIMMISYCYYSKTLKKYPHDSSELRQLARSLTRPEVNFKTKSTIIKKDSNNTDEFIIENSSKNKKESFSGSFAVKLILPEDIYSEQLIDFIDNNAVKKFGNLDLPVIKSTGFAQFDEPELSNNLKFENNDKALVLICFESWQPPVKQTLDYIKNLRNIAGKHLEIMVVLIGKPGKENLFSKVDENDFKLWSSKIKSMKDPFLSIFSLNPE
ncbi:MAG: DUF2868 domain-containing protein [Thermodesulfobacteriota bacterium]